MFTNTLSLLPARAKKQVLRSMVASLNQSIIGYVRTHLRNEFFNRTNGIDGFNEMKADHAEQAVDAILKTQMGMEVTMPANEVAENLIILRNWMEQEIAITGATEYDKPFSLLNSLVFQLQRAPRTNNSELSKLAEATGISLERLKAAEVSRHEDDHTELVKYADQIIDFYDDISSKDHFCSDERIETFFDKLPIHVQYKLLVKMHEVLDDIAEKTVKLMLTPRQRGSSDAAGDIKMIDAARAEHHKFLLQFDEKHAPALDQYAERAVLPAIPELNACPVAQAMDEQSKTEGKMQKAPAPTVDPLKAQINALIDKFNKKERALA